MVRSNVSSAAPARLAAAHADAVDAGDLREIFDALTHGLCVIEVIFNDAGKCVDYLFLEVNEAFESQTGLPNARGRLMRAMRPAHEQHWFDVYGEIARTGEPKRFTAEAAALSRWYDVYAFRLGQPELNRVAIVFEDVTERKRLEERQVLLDRETVHRSRNLFALVTALLQMTKASTVAEYKTLLERRVRALFSTHAIEQESAPEDFDALARHEMAPYEANGRITFEGTPVAIDKGRLQCLAVALHELATNSVKHGALSAPAGKIALRWRAEAGALHVEWAESGGPNVIKPKRTGVGTIVIERCVREQLGGQVSFGWDAAGLRCTIAVPVVGKAEAGHR